MAKYYRTRITIDVLSEDEPATNFEDLADVASEITDGGWVGGPVASQATELSPVEMAAALKEFGSTVSFFEGLGAELDGVAAANTAPADSEPSTTPTPGI